METRGSGFLIAEGMAITCHHVVAELDVVRIQAPDGTVHELAPMLSAWWPDIDLAPLRCRALRGSPLALAATDATPQRFWTKGFQWQGPNIRAAFPLEGSITGLLDDLAYRWLDHAYSIGPVYVLGQEQIDHGLSGAPLVDPKWGVVVGVVSATLKAHDRRGFAIPFSTARAYVPAVGELLEANDRDLPRWGPYLNARAARLACERQLGEARERLETDKLVLRERHAERASIEAGVEAFLAADRALLPIVGGSGVGKTSELAHLSRKLHPPVLLLQAGDLGGTSELLEAVERQLPAVAEDTPGRVIEVLCEAGDRPVVLVDGFNEAAGRLAVDEETWLRRTLKWLRQMEVRLVITSRLELWTRVARDLDSAAMSAQLEVTDFTREEATEALARYGLTDSGLSPDDVRHPLLARIYLNLGEVAEGRALSRYRAIEEFVTRQAEQVAEKTGTSSLMIEATLAGLVTRGLDVRSLVIDRRAVLEAEAPGGIVSGLLAENVLTRVEQDFRFSFDEVAEFILSREFDLEAVDAGSPALVEIPPGARMFLLLRLEREGDDPGLRDALSVLLDAFATQGDLLFEGQLIQFFSALEEPRRLWDELVRYYETALEVNGWTTLASASNWWSNSIFSWPRSSSWPLSCSAPKATIPGGRRTGLGICQATSRRGGPLRSPARDATHRERAGDGRQRHARLARGRCSAGGRGDGEGRRARAAVSLSPPPPRRCSRRRRKGGRPTLLQRLRPIPP